MQSKLSFFFSNLEFFAIYVEFLSIELNAETKPVSSTVFEGKPDVFRYKMLSKNVIVSSFDSFKRYLKIGKRGSMKNVFNVIISSKKRNNLSN